MGAAVKKDDRWTCISSWQGGIVRWDQRLLFDSLLLMDPDITGRHSN